MRKSSHKKVVRQFCKNWDSAKKCITFDGCFSLFNIHNMHHYIHQLQGHSTPTGLGRFQPHPITHTHTHTYTHHGTPRTKTQIFKAMKILKKIYYRCILFYSFVCYKFCLRHLKVLNFRISPAGHLFGKIFLSIGTNFWTKIYLWL